MLKADILMLLFGWEIVAVAMVKITGVVRRRVNWVSSKDRFRIN